MTRTAFRGSTSRDRGPAACPLGQRAALLVVVVLLIAATACSDGDTRGGPPTAEQPTSTSGPASAPPRTEPLPVVVPTPREAHWAGPDLDVGAAVRAEVDAEVDEPTRSLLVEVFTEAGATDIEVVEAEEAADADTGDTGDTADDSGDEPLRVRVGRVDDAAVADALARAGVTVPDPLPAEGYALAVLAGGPDHPGTVTIAAAEATGWFYGAQTLRQLVRDGSVAGLAIVDHPAIPLRGTIEGFYGSPWTHAERLDQLAFYGRFKLNTYVYAPKDDPYHRDRWREPYPAGELARLEELVDAAAANHVRFTFAVSPGPSICYSDPGDVDALAAKLSALYDLGVRSFSIALDDIVHDRWNCDADASAFGPPSTEAAAQAQVGLLNTLQAGFVATHEGTRPLLMVPTEYRRTDDSPYRQVLRAQLDPAVEVMWTGVLVVPAEITVAQARAAAEVFGRPTVIWDNTPVNDFPPTEGRLLLGPYTRREPGLSAVVSGLVLNPMNQAAASKVALIGGADFAWNDTAYDPARAHRAAASRLAGGDEEATEALLAFFDVENLAPTSASDGRLSQPQAPALAADLDAFRRRWAAGDRAGAVAGLRPRARLLADAPALIREAAPADFVADVGPWLDALALWGEALTVTLDGLEARSGGDEAAAEAAFAEADALVAEAGSVHTIEGETRPQGPVRVADGVLDTFLSEARSLR